MLKSVSWQIVTIGALVAGWICADPFLSYTFGFNRFPYFLTSVLAGLVVLIAVLALNGPRLYRHKDFSLLVFIVAASQFSGMGIGSLDVLDVSSVGLFALWLFIAATESRAPVQTSPIMFAALGLMFLAVLALINRPPIGGLIAISEKFALFFAVVALLQRRPLIEQTTFALIAASVFSSLVAIGQTVVFWVWGILWTTGIGESQAMGYLKPTPFGVMPRSTAFFPNPAGLNDYLLFCSGLILFAVANAKSTKWKWFYILAFVLNCAGITLTWSASSLSGLALVMLLFVYFNRPALTIHYTAAIGFVLIVCYWSGLLEFMYRLMKNYASSSGEVRLRLLELAMEVLDRQALIGMGVQNFANASGNLFQEGVFTVAYPVHNAFGQMATELGVFGALIYLSIVAFIIARIIRVLRLPNVPEKWIFKGYLLGMLPLIIHMFSEPMAYEGTLWLLFGIIEGSAMIVLRPLRAVSIRKPEARVAALNLGR